MLALRWEPAVLTAIAAQPRSWPGVGNVLARGVRQRAAVTSLRAAPATQKMVAAPCPSSSPTGALAATLMNYFY